CPPPTAGPRTDTPRHAPTPTAPAGATRTPAHQQQAAAGTAPHRTTPPSPEWLPRHTHPTYAAFV
ncbi:hypothetical protein ACFZAV_42655, partial [Streptomyces sp. NPDC008343]